jgi:SAM-dependent methyltransferase
MVDKLSRPARDFEEYVKQLQLEQFFEELGASNPKILAKEAEYFTTKEAEKRDKIVLNYFGKTGVNRIVDTITTKLLEPPRLPANSKILDAGAGTGFFTTRIAWRIHAKLPQVSFYAMDLTPAMLLALKKKSRGVIPLLGIAENIEGSLAKAKEYSSTPRTFDAIYSTLMLHHSLNPEEVFKSMKTVLKKNRKAMVLDLCEHGFEEFRTEMGDVHLGFKPGKIEEMARKHFTNVKVEKMRGISCECSGRAAEIFTVLMQNRS